LKVLISAYSITPHGSSEQGVGWNWSVQAARNHEVWVLTNSFPRRSITAEMEEHPNPNLHFVYYSTPKEVAMRDIAHKFHPVFYPNYLAWQATAIKTARRLHHEIGFDVAQHVTWASYRFPSVLAAVDVPFIWGPIGGGETAPARLYPQLGLRPALGEVVRETSNWLTRLDPFVRRTASRATRILVTSEETKNKLPGSARKKAEVYPAIGLSLQELDAEVCRAPEDEERGGVARLLFAGRLVSWKGCNFAIQALAQLLSTGTRARLTVAGVGPNLDSLKTLAYNLGVAEHVDFLGNVPRAEVLRLCQTHDVFVFPSLHDSGGVAVLEAMYLGLPVVCLDLGGPAISVGDAGVRVAAHNVDQIVDDLASSIRRILNDDAFRRDITTRARERVIQLYDWDHKAQYISDLYERTATAGR
jgi:glycosyltransferase involved in cell wall biosynthesis